MDEIASYNLQQPEPYSILCEHVAAMVSSQLSKYEGITSKVWHGHPVWLSRDNPIVGYAVRKNGVQMLFWSGQSFNEAGLQPEGSFKAAQKYFASNDEISESDVRRWLDKSIEIQWDYKNIIKRKGKLIRL